MVLGISAGSIALIAIAVVAFLALVLIVVGPSRRVRAEPPLDPDEESAVLLGENPDNEDESFRDDDRDVVERPGEIGRQRVERPADVLLEPARVHQAGWSGGRACRGRTSRRPYTNPLMWAKNATPPP